MTMTMTMDTSKVRRWINPQCRPLDLPPGVHVPLADMGDGRLMTVQDGAAMASEDDGKIWSQVGRLYDGPPPAFQAAACCCGRGRACSSSSIRT